MSRYIDADVVNIDELCRLRSNLRTGLYVGYTLNTQRQINRFIKALDEIIDSCTPTIEPKKGKWIPVKYRPLTVDECIAFADHYGIEYCDTVDEKAFDCPMPEDRQEILVSGSWGVSTDVADNDIDGEGFIVYGLEGNGDWEGIDAWMPLPEPYKRGDKE